MDTMGEGEGETNRESSMETYTLPFVKYISSGNLLNDVGNSDPLLCDNLEGWLGVGGGREVQKGGDICIPMADSCWRLTENNKIL